MDGVVFVITSIRPEPPTQVMYTDFAHLGTLVDKHIAEAELKVAGLEEGMSALSDEKEKISADVERLTQEYQGCHSLARVIETAVDCAEKLVGYHTRSGSLGSHNDSVEACITQLQGALASLRCLQPQLRAHSGSVDSCCGAIELILASVVGHLDEGSEHTS